MNLRSRSGIFIILFVGNAIFLTATQSLVAQSDAAAKQRFSQTDLFELEYAVDPQISPDGKKIVYCRISFDIMTDRTRSQLWLVDTQGESHRPLTDFDVNVSTPRWSPDGTRIAYVASDGKNAQVFCRWMAEGVVAKVTSLVEAPQGIKWSPDGKQFAFSSFVPRVAKPAIKLPTKPKGASWAEPPKMITRLKYRADGKGYLRDGFQHLFVVRSEGGTPRQVTTGDYDHPADFAWGRQSESLVFCANRSPDAELEPNRQDLYRVDIASRKMEILAQRKGKTSQPILLDDGSILFLGNVDDLKGYQPSSIYRLQKDGSEEVISGELDRNIRALRFSTTNNNVLFLYDDEGRTNVGAFSLNGEFKKLATDVGGTSIGRPYSSGSFSISNEGRLAYTICDPHSPSNVATVAKDGAIAKLIELNKDLLAHREMGQVEQHWFSSSFDNRRIQSWIVKPPQFDAGKKYPLILEIHGGPFANYGPRFSAEMQLMAAAGYVVLYVNPRGSTSYGKEFGNLIHHRYPGNDYDDLISAVDSVIEKGFVDPNQLYVTGGSGGGVLTSWIVGKTNRFKAAVVAKPVINWFSFALTADSYNYFYKYWFPGYPWDHSEAYMSRSPISLVGNVETPTMLLTGEQDFRTPISESEQFYQALKLRKVKTALVRVPGAGHGIAARPSHLLSKIAYILYWFESNSKKP